MMTKENRTVLQLKRERIVTLDAQINTRRTMVKTLTELIDVDIEERVRLAAHVRDLEQREGEE